MELFGVKTEIIRAGESICESLNKWLVVSDQWLVEDDIVIISSKAIATSEGRVMDLKKITPSNIAKNYSEKCGRSAEFCEIVLNEIEFRNGKVVGVCPGAIFTSLKPNGMNGEILCANAGMDESNIEKGYAVGWPEDPVVSASELRKNIKASIIISDSCCRPRRWGVTAFALAVAGIDPLHDQSGKKDLFGRELRITKEATADQLATAANILMGNADKCVPVVIVRNHGIELSNYEGWVPGVCKSEDLFGKIA
ncbi:coenzyme F420-0:L-glutamate ligase [Candidatus Peribacteria bacterium]|nr:coenzyme F420-0:L-glutamate ligase [Candidatus Peribacteria bacterium]MBT4240268.1 coenzyme F420-0:L-glutamate ligase [Candidatus Peribacteria bacterium]MBT4474329.1 coenzyme F420-0:L-glutamate ligase [Candidatus Peribacteria bacterium]